MNKPTDDTYISGYVQIEHFMLDDISPVGDLEKELEELRLSSDLNIEKISKFDVSLEKQTKTNETAN